MKINLKLFLSFLSATFLSNTSAATCSQAFMTKLKENSTRTIKMNCSAKLSAKDIIKKTIIFEGKSGSNITLDCAGAQITGPSNSDIIKISSRLLDKSKFIYERAENITIKNCHIKGSMRILGMGNNGEADMVKRSSRLDSEHTKRAQAAAPRNIVLSHMTFEGQSRVPLYLSPGVTRVTVQDSVFRGKSASVALYLDAESAHNKILRNTFDTDRDKREMIAIDGSAYNIISGNMFKRAKHGVIYLYRNCGEGSTIRIQTPSHNQITGNWFPTAASDGRLIINSRSGDRKYCSDDKGKNYGSSSNDKDLGSQNIVAGNYFKGSRVGIVQKENKNNFLFSNRSQVSSGFSKKAICATTTSTYQEGQSFVLYKTNNNQCSKVQRVCKNGSFVDTSSSCGDEK